MEQRRHGSVFIVIGVLARVLGSAEHAAANCAGPVTYDISTADHTVTITPVNESHRGCPASDGLLRQNVETGEIVRVPDVCGPDPKNDYQGRSFIDECVPAGTYRYGFAEPYTCVSYACGTYLFTEVTMSLPLGDCQRDHPDEVPSTVSSVPWGKSSVICRYAGEGYGDEEPGCGCAALPPGGRSVLIVDLGAGVFAGLVLLVRRLRRGRS